ncbi:MAG TPA: anaerobic glycerol-3-phosphate dehydrogenase subunit B [Syntrophomonadaceae bacterium]|nr:anaerobic glycerol-3-phosphate dehydrogenase subunit B [Syntrophomonadaceae bacterium]
MSYDVVVIGAGLAGLTAAIKALEQGLKTIVISRGASTLEVMSGCIDFYGGAVDPWPGIRDLARENPCHPYALLEEEEIYQALSFFIQEVKSICPYHHQEGFQNYRLPTALGQMRTSCLLPQGQVVAAGVNERVLVVGFKGYRDFCSALMAEGMNKKGCSWRSIDVDLKLIQGLDNSPDCFYQNSASVRSYQNSIQLAVCLERAWPLLAEELRPQVQDVDKVAFPAVLGLDRYLELQQGLEESLGKRVFEVPNLPPSLPGIRLSKCLMDRVRQLGGDLLQGSSVVAAEKTGDICSKVLVKTAGKKREIQGKCYIIATGRMSGKWIALQGEGVVAEKPGLLKGSLKEAGSSDQQCPRALAGAAEHSSTGIKVNKQLQPLDNEGKILLANVFCAGSVLAGYDPFSEGSGGGVAIATGYRAAVLAAKGVKGQKRQSNQQSQTGCTCSREG